MGMSDDAYACDVCGGPTFPQAFSAGREYWCDACDTSFLYAHERKRNEEDQAKRDRAMRITPIMWADVFAYHNLTIARYEALPSEAHDGYTAYAVVNGYDLHRALKDAEDRAKQSWMETIRLTDQVRELEEKIRILTDPRDDNDTESD